MSRIAEKILEIEELLYQNYDCQTVAKMTGVPINWVKEIEDELYSSNYNIECDYEDQA